MSQVRLVHWKAAEAQERVACLRAAGYEVIYDTADGPDLLRQLRDDPPTALVIDLSRQPSHGRDLALAVRQYKATRGVPLVFVEGDPEKVTGIRQLLPDAVYTSWDEIENALAQAIIHPPTTPVVPESRMAGYAGRPLVTKLGIKPKTVVALVGAPAGFREALGELPDGVELRTKADASCDLIVWFARSRRELQEGISRMTASAPHAGLWLAWPKRASGLESDLSQQAVRESGLAAGLVDYKVCAIDETWSGLLFRRRKSPRL